MYFLQRSCVPLVLVVVFAFQLIQRGESAGLFGLPLPIPDDVLRILDPLTDILPLDKIVPSDPKTQFEDVSKKIPSRPTDVLTSGDKAAEHVQGYLDNVAPGKDAVQKGQKNDVDNKHE